MRVLSPPGRLRALYLVIGAAVSLLATVVAVPWIEGLQNQIHLMIDGFQEEQQAAREAYRRALGREPQIRAVESALSDADHGRTEFRTPQRDHENGLYACLQVMGRLPEGSRADRVATRPSEATRGAASGLSPAFRAPSTGPSPSPGASSRPAEDAALADEIRRLKDSPPAKLYAGRYWAMARDAFESTRLPLRQAVVEANGVDLSYGLRYRPVIRRLAGGLLAQARAWREAGHTADAVAADAALARLMFDLLDDSPRPDVLLMAADYIPPALWGLADEAARAGLPPGVVEDSLRQAARIEAVRGRWHESVNRGINLLPRTGDAVLAPREHDRVIGSMVAAGYAMGTWVGLGVVIVLLAVLPSSIDFWNSGRLVRWRWGGWGRPAAVAIVLGPMLTAILVFLAIDLPLVWLISLPSAGGAILPVLAVPVLVGLAARICVLLPDEHARARLTRTAVIAIAAVAVVVILVGLAIPTRPEAWRPPAGIQLYRRLGIWVGGESLVLMLVWMIWGRFRRRRLKVSGGPQAVACLGVAVWAWAASALIGLGVLQLNARNDARHERAFVAAAADPLGDRLGPNWREAHFQGVRELVGRIQGR